ncbi:MAG: penicillin-binding protein 1C [Bacteroidetes bacterium]|nr:penicillin-binding protein 1C [Bacteroidota bacterium]
MIKRKELIRKLAGWGEFILLTAFGMFFLFFLMNIIFPVKEKIPYSQQILAADNTLMYAFLSDDEKWRMLVRSEEINQQLRKAILYKEDRFFYYHFGVNPVAIIRAAFNNIVYQKRTSGASTITMQVARLLYPQERTYLNKFTEMFRSFQLEWKYSKEEILNMYFNLVPYGGNIEGIKAASLIYFGRNPDKMSLAQIVSLAIIPNRPGTLRPGANTGELVKARNKWLSRMKHDKLFSDELIEDALKEPIDAKRSELPRLAPHFSLRMHVQYPDLPIVKTTINLHHQQQLNQIASNYSKRLHGYGIYNAAVVVLNNRTHSIEAYLGSSDFNDMLHSGQVDGVTAVRSPGSTLKPLVYSIAFDDGLLTPKSMIADVPVNYDGYAPENYNSKFNGNVTVEHALANSLNIPAVKTLNMIGLKSLTDKMKLAGFGQVLHSEGSIGLSVILGGCGVKLEELTALFSTYANEGKFFRPHYLKSDTINAPVQLMTPSASYMTADILSQVNRPEMPAEVASSAMHLPKIAWKTGTSYGRRDAWSIGFNSDYTIGVWIGNFSGEGVPELTGAEMATPLLFELFNTIDYNSGKSRLIPPAELDFRLVCSETGLLPEENCTNRVIDYYIPQVTSVVRCNHLKKVFITADSSFSYCTSCLPENGFKTAEYPNLNPDIISYYESEKISYRKIPPHNPKCERVFSEHEPQITSLLNKKEYTVERDEKHPPQLLLAATVSNDVSQIFWYINDRFYKSANAGEDVFFIPEEGKIKISCSDDKGRNSNISITVKNF